MNKYDGVLVPKAWGFEHLVFDNGAAAIWLLHIATKRKTSMHCHPNKRTTLIVLAGAVEVSRQFVDGIAVRKMLPLEVEEIPKGDYHQTEAISDLDGYPSAEDGAWLLEIETPSDKEDLVRAEDAYGRAGTAYETNVVPYAGELLQLVRGKSRKWMGLKFDLKLGPTVIDGALALAIPEPGRDWDGLTLNIQKDTTMKVSEYVADCIDGLGIKHVFGVSGGGSMHITDSFGRRGMFIPTHHEQAAAFAAEAYARLNGIGCCAVTTGPGGTNTITGVACAWIDSIPVVFISGQVTRDTIMQGHGIRQLGVQESDIVEIVKPITKYAVTIRHASEIRFEMEKAVHIAREGRPGPVWIDIPLDIQPQLIDPAELIGHHPYDHPEAMPLRPMVGKALIALRESKRPVLIVGNGVRLAGAERQIVELIDALGIPVVSSWTGSDLIGDHQNHIGRCGIFGDRASNFAVQNADLLLVIGCRLSIPQIGYNRAAFAREAKIIMVDVDDREINKPGVKVWLPVVADARDFIGTMLSAILVESTIRPHQFSEWTARCLMWKGQYPVVLPEYAAQKDSVNSYWFVNELCTHLPDDATVVMDMGTAFTGTYQAAKMRPGQRWITASGHAPMGWALPGAVGAAFATGKRVICIVGDGSLQFNIQELATIAHNQLPITIFVLNNGGYLTIKAMQQNHFSRYTGAEAGSGVSFPDVVTLCDAYKIPSVTVRTKEDMLFWREETEDRDGPIVIEIMMSPDQPLIPRVASKKLPDGSVKSAAIEDMFPYLPRDEFNANMLVPTEETLK